MAIVAILGTLAAICTTGAFIPQIIKIHRQGGEDLSYGMLGVYLAGVVLWLCYGLQLGAQAVIWANTTAAILVVIAIVMKMMHAKRAVMLKDVERRARKMGVPLAIPPADAANAARSAWRRFRRAQARPRLAVDMDEVIADAFGKVLRSYNERTGSSVTRDQISEKGFEGTMKSTLTPEMFAEYERMCHTGDFFADLELMEGSQEALRELSEHYEIFIASAAMDVPSSFDAKFKWLQRHFSFIPPSHYVFCGDKSILLADYLIDDRPRHFDHFAGTGILFTAPHNARRDVPLRANNWADVVRILTEARMPIAASEPADAASTC
ncbi:MAG: PQ-loop domain-containing transporter [Candidatus Acidiferrales bacterium]